MADSNCPQGGCLDSTPVEADTSYCTFKNIVSLPIIATIWHYVMIVYHALKKVPFISLYIILMEVTVKYFWKMYISIVLGIIGEKNLRKLDKFVCEELKKTEQMITNIENWIYKWAKKFHIISLLDTLHAYFKGLALDISKVIEKIIHFFHPGTPAKKDIWQEIKAFVVAIEDKIIAFAKHFTFEAPPLGRSSDNENVNDKKDQLTVTKVITFFLHYLDEMLVEVQKQELPSTWMKVVATCYGSAIHTFLTGMKHLSILYRLIAHFLDRLCVNMVIHMAGALLLMLNLLVKWFKNEEQYEQTPERDYGERPGIADLPTF